MISIISSSLSSFHQSAHAKIEFNINVFLSGIDWIGSLYREKKIYLLACRFLFYFSNLLLFLCAFQSFSLLTRHWLNLFHQKKTEASCINIFLQVASLPPQRGGACELECVRPSFYHLKWKKNLLFHRLNTVRWESTRLFFCWLFFFFFTFYWKATPLFRSAGAV